MKHVTAVVEKEHLFEIAPHFSNLLDIFSPSELEARGGSLWRGQLRHIAPSQARAVPTSVR